VVIDYSCSALAHGLGHLIQNTVTMFWIWWGQPLPCLPYACFCLAGTWSHKTLK